jgi:hypothetical protein
MLGVEYNLLVEGKTGLLCIGNQQEGEGECEIKEDLSLDCAENEVDEDNFGDFDDNYDNKINKITISSSNVNPPVLRLDEIYKLPHSQP